MELQRISQIQDLIIFKLYYLKLFSFLLIFTLTLSCESSKIESIKINEDLYLAPGSKNNKGCTEFRMISKSGKPTKQVIFTVNKKGEYSPGQIKKCI